jgi:hypothetical protein
MRALGWVVLAEKPGCEIVVGAVTQPWEANVTFRSVSTERFAAFNEPGYVKIVWTLRADAIGDAASIFRTETRAVATDASATREFRRYWAFLSPGNHPDSAPDARTGEGGDRAAGREPLLASAR